MQPVGYLLFYLPFFFFGRTFAAAHYTQIIWGIYFTLIIGISLTGLRILLNHLEPSHHAKSFHFFLPKGFWKYTFSLQELSALNFFSQRLDVFLILNVGNLAVLGKYVAIITLADSIRTVNRYITDTLLPSLTNVLAEKNYAGATDVFAMHMRILLLVNAAGQTPSWPKVEKEKHIKTHLSEADPYCPLLLAYAGKQDSPNSAWTRNTQ